MSVVYPEPEPRAEGEPEGGPVIPESEVNSTANPGDLGRRYPSAAEIILPAVSLNLIILIGSVL